MKKLSFMLCCLFVSVSAFADIDVGEMVNKKYLWNGDNVTNAVINGYADYLESLKDASQHCVTDANCETQEERAFALEDREKLAKFLLEQERFSLNDALQGCVTNRVVTPNEVCGKVVSYLTNILYDKGSYNIGYNINKKENSECHLINRLVLHNGEQVTDKKFVYSSKQAQDYNRGFSCEKSYERACKHGDEVTFDQGAFFKGEKIEGKVTFRCDLLTGPDHNNGWRLVQ